MKIKRILQLAVMAFFLFEATIYFYKIVGVGYQSDLKTYLLIGLMAGGAQALSVVVVDVLSALWTRKKGQLA